MNLTLLLLTLCSVSSADVHPERAAMIDAIKKTDGVLWNALAHPRFAAEAPGASKDMCGVKGDHKAAIQEAVAKGEIQEFVGESNAAIPDSFDSEENWPQCAKIIGDIRDQSNCGCCWAFGGAEAASDRMCIATNASIMVPLSAQDVCFNAGFHIPGLIGGCSGGQVGTPWSYIKSAGAVTGGQYNASGAFGAGLCSSFSMPHCHHHGPQGSDPYPAEGQPGCPSQKSPAGPKTCDSDAKAPHNDFAGDKYSFEGSTVSASGEQNIQQAIMAGGPMETAFTVYSDFENYAGGIYHHVSGSMAGGHAVKFVGWGVEGGVKYWKVANSWNPHWGEKGYFRIKRGTNEGGIENSAVASSPSAKWSRKGSFNNVHPERAAMIDTIQKTDGVLWKALAHPRFAAEAPGASKDMCGVKGDHKAAIQEAVAKGEIEEFVGDANAAVPDSFDSEANWPQCAKIIGDIRDQSNCGCCWAFGGAEAASDRMCIATNASIMVPLSAQDVCFNAGFHIPGLIGGCSGGQVGTPWSYIKSAGAVTGGQYNASGAFGAGLCSAFSMPHCHHHGPQGSDPYPAEGQPGCPSQKSPAGPKACDSGATAPHNDFAGDKYSFEGSTVSASGEQNIQQAIMAGGPMETAFTVYSDFENYAGGVYHHVSGSMAGGHAVKFVGWGVDGGVKYWKVANSWNPYWGEKGYFRIKRGSNEGGIENSAVASSPSAKWSRKGSFSTRIVV